MKAVNVEILGKPVNIVIVALMIVAFWFALYALTKGGIPSINAPRIAGGENNGTVS